MAATSDREITLDAAGEKYPEFKISVSPKPLIAPTNTSKRILVLGGGVSGLITAWMLLDKGYRVTILSKEWAWTSDFQRSRITSQIAGALWEFPPGGCGLTEIESPGKGWATITHYREWALQSYAFYRRLNSMLDGQLKTDFGIVITKLNQFFYHELSDPNEFNKRDILKLEAIRKAAKEGKIDNVKEHNSDSLNQIFDSLETRKPWISDLKAAYTHDAPIVNPDKAMMYLMATVKNKGAELETLRITQPLREIAYDLKTNYVADAIINATGLGAREVAGDPDVYPVRGAIKRISNNYLEHFRPLHQAYLVPAQKGDDGQPTKVVFLVPRNDDTLIVGSIAQPHNEEMGLTEGDPEVEVMWGRACHFLPGLAHAKTIPWYPLAQGLRPFTKKNVKVRADMCIGVPVVHNYGHGGSGWTLAIGTSRSAIHLMELVLNRGKTADQANALLYD